MHDISQKASPGVLKQPLGSSMPCKPPVALMVQFLRTEVKIARYAIVVILSGSAVNFNYANSSEKNRFLRSPLVRSRGLRRLR